jgi:hypothetical protein
VNFSHIPKFEILGCDQTTPLNRNLTPRFSGIEKKRIQGTVKTEIELTIDVPDTMVAAF